MVLAARIRRQPIAQRLADLIVIHLDLVVDTRARAAEQALVSKQTSEDWSLTSRPARQAGAFL